MSDKDKITLKAIEKRRYVIRETVPKLHTKPNSCPGRFSLAGGARQRRALPSKLGKSALGTRLIRDNQASGKIASFDARLLVSAHETREYFRYKTGGFARYNSKTCTINS